MSGRWCGATPPRAPTASISNRIHKVLDGGLGACYRTNYALTAPNPARWRLDTGPATTDTVWAGEDRYTREGTGAWKHQRTPGLTISWPLRNWSDREGNVADLGPTTWHSRPARLLAFIDLANGNYHRLWVDRDDGILHERMDAPGHFMDRDYAGYGQLVRMTRPR